MKVLHFYKTYFPDSYGGVEQVINQIACSTREHGVDSKVLTLSKHIKPSQPVVIDEHKVYQAHLDFQIASTGFSLSAFAHFSALIKQVDLIHYHFPWPFMDLVHLAKKPKIPTVVTYHSDIVRQKTLLKLYQPVRNSFLSSVDQIIVTSPNLLSTSQTLKRYQDKTTIIPIGLDKSSYPTVQEPLLTQWRGRLPEKFFLFVGVLRYYKGLDILLTALKQVDYPVVIVGAGPFETKLRVQAAQLKLTNVIFLGTLSPEDKVALFKLCYAFVFPSNLRSEAFGVSLLEAAMFGKPLISCEIGTGTSYINIHHQTGLVVPPHDPTSLAKAMTFLWKQPEKARQMGKAAEQRYLSLFTGKQMALSHVALYAKLLNPLFFNYS